MTGVFGQLLDAVRMEDAVFVPLIQDQIVIEVTNGSISRFPAGADSGGEGAPTGANSTLFVNLSNGSVPAGSQITFNVKGRCFAPIIRNIPPPTGIVDPSYNVIIDGEQFIAPNPTVYFNGEAQSALDISTGYSSTLFINDLPDGDHTVNIMWTTDTVANRRNLVYGFLGDPRHYKADTFVKISSAVPTTVTATPILLATDPTTLVSPAAPVYADRRFKFFSGVEFYNTDTSDDVVEVYRDTTVIAAVPVPHGSSAKWEPARGTLTGLGGYSVRRRATSGAPIIATVWGTP